MSSTSLKRSQLWVCWQEPDGDRGKVSLIPSSWIAKCITGDGVSAGSLVLCRWPRSEDLFTAKVIHDPTPNDLSKVEVMDVPMFMGESDEGSTAAGGGAALRKALGRRDRPPASPIKGSSDDSMLGNLKRFFLSEMTKISGEMQANFDILGHRIGALEVGMKCVRERVERIENMLNTAVHDLDVAERDTGFGQERNLGNGNRRTTSMDAPATVPKQRSHDARNSVKPAIEVEENGGDEEPRAVVIPRENEQRPRKDRNPRPRAVVVTCPRNRNVVYLGGDERYRMPLPTYLDAIRHAKRPTATYMVTALLRRYLPMTTLAKLCVNERQLTNTKGGEMLDDELLEVLKKQGRMQFPHTQVAERELVLRIEDVARDVRRKLKLKKAGITTTTSKRSSAGASSSFSTPISMVTAQRPVITNAVSTKSHSKADPDDDDQGDDQILQLKDADGMGIDDDSGEYFENPEPLPMFS